MPVPTLPPPLRAVGCWAAGLGQRRAPPFPPRREPGPEREEPSRGEQKASSPEASRENRRNCAGCLPLKIDKKELKQAQARKI